MATTLIPDSMTPLERIGAFLSGRTYDRTPCHLLLSDHAAKVLGVTVTEYHTSAEVMARGQVASYRKYGHDVLAVGPGLVGVAEALGSKVAFPGWSSPYIAEYGVRGPEDLAALELPDPARTARYPLFLEALERALDEVGQEVPVAMTVAGPFTTVSNLRGAENLMRDLYHRPEFAHRLLQIALDATLVLVRETARRGGRISLADPVASGSLISPRQFREFVLPYEKALVDAIREATGSAPVLHICGNTKKIWDLMAETGAGYFSLDDAVDLAEAKEAVGDRVVLVGNISPSDTMYRGTPEKVWENARECFRKAYDSPKGFILALGCGLPLDAPEENVLALVAAARDLGRYPLDPERFL